MTYYGRWTYKFEEAARQGAAAALIIHDTAGASYGWDVVKNSWSGAQYDLPAKDDPEPRLPAQGWITGDAAHSAVRRRRPGPGQGLRAAASKRGFKPVPLNAKLSLRPEEHHRSRRPSRNVVGVLPGSKRPDEAMLYMAHWDHLGKHEGEPRRQHLQRRGRQRHRRGRHPRDRRGVRARSSRRRSVRWCSWR